MRGPPTFLDRKLLLHRILQFLISSHFPHFASTSVRPVPRHSLATQMGFAETFFFPAWEPECKLRSPAILHSLACTVVARQQKAKTGSKREQPDEERRTMRLSMRTAKCLRVRLWLAVNGVRIPVSRSGLAPFRFGREWLELRMVWASLSITRRCPLLSTAFY